MTGDKITYGESIECPGKWRRMDYETTVKEGETDKEAANRAQCFVQNFLSQNNPHLYQEQDTIQPYNGLSSITNVRPPELEEKISPEQEIESLLLAISEANETELPQYKLLASQNIKTLGAFQKRKKQLGL